MNKKLILKKFKTWLIHKLGGYVEADYQSWYLREHENVLYYSFLKGYKYGIFNGQIIYKNGIIQYIKSIYGVDKQEWIDNVCEYLSNRIKKC